MIGELMQLFAHMDFDTKENLRRLAADAMRAKNAGEYIKQKLARVWQPDDWHFRVLGIKPEASLGEIEAAAKKLAPMVHPDRMKGMGHLYQLVQEAKERALQGPR